MAASKPSLSSPIPPPSRPNPNARSSETKDPMRRSFTGNPFTKPSSIVPNSRANPNTPANSPTDFPRRSSISRESLTSLREFEDKENSKDSNLKTARVRSPASASKGTKNFMSPTISAASKFATSPRKKILVERNEPVRSSVSFSEAKVQAVEDNETKPEISLGKKKTVTFSDVKDLIMMEDDEFSKPEMGLNQMIESSYDSTITDLGREEITNSSSGLDSEVLLDSKSEVSSSLVEAPATEEKDCVNLDPTFKTSPTSNPMLAPLDADPLMPPYDPKTNYLSPRPQFLHYRPNPRIESMLNKVKDGKRLEESFASENLSDSEVSEIQSEDSLKESEDISSDETVKETKEEEDEAVEEDEEEKLNVSEPNPFGTDKPEESVQVKRESKSELISRSKFIALGLILAFACLSISVSDSQVSDLIFSNLYVPPEITEFAKENFEELVQKFQLWSANSYAYICKLISSLRGMHELGPLQYCNLTILLEKDKSVGTLKFAQEDASADFKYENDFWAPIREENIKLEEGHEEIEDDKSIEEIEDNRNLEEILEEENSPEFEAVHQEIEEHDDNINVVSEDRTNSQCDEICSTSLAQVFKPEIEDDKSIEEIEDNRNLEEILEEENSPEFEAVHQEIEEHDDNINVVSEDRTNSQCDEICSTSLAQVFKPDNLVAEEPQEIVASDIKLQSDMDLLQQHVLISEVDRTQPDVMKFSDIAENQPDVAALTEVAEPHQFQGETDAETVSSKAEDVVYRNSELDNSMANLQNSATLNGSENNYMTKRVAGISLSVLLSVLLAIAYAKIGKPSTPNTPTTTSHQLQPAVTKKLDYSPISVAAQHTSNWQTEEETVGESCPSEMSSFKSTSYSKKGLNKASSEAQSQERRQPRNGYRRESLASSQNFSMGSPSYGSFTTYEKISSKGCGDDEVVTPVRRSSRIRKQVTSS